MIQIPVFYATSEGQTARIADRLASHFREHGFSSEAIDVTSEAARTFDWTGVQGVVLGASLHLGRHQAAARRFVRDHVQSLAARPSAFFSVSLSAASANAVEAAEAGRLARAFCEDAGWHPAQIATFGGCLAYTRYGWLTRQLLRRIARKEGGPTDTSRDHELTNWQDVSALANQMMGRLEARLAS